MASGLWTTNARKWDGEGTRTPLKGHDRTEKALIKAAGKCGKGTCAEAGRRPAALGWLRERALADLWGGQDPGRVFRILAGRIRRVTIRPGGCWTPSKRAACRWRRSPRRRASAPGGCGAGSASSASARTVATRSASCRSASVGRRQRPRWLAPHSRTPRNPASTSAPRAASRSRISSGSSGGWSGSDARPSARGHRQLLDSAYG